MPRALPVLCCLLLASAALADGPQTNVLTKAPTLLTQVEAIYPAGLADAGVGGTVGLEVDIGADGKVLEARVAQSSGQPLLDEAAVAALKQFEFTPAEVDGQPAPVRIAYNYTFAVKPQVFEVPAAPDAGVPVVNFAGLLVSAGTRDPIEGALVSVADGDGGTRDVVSDPAGRFELTDLPVGPVRVTVAAPAFSTFEATEELRAGERTEVKYYVRPSADLGRETVVRAQRDQKEVAQVKLVMQEIRYVAGARGDAFRVVQNLPGVARTPFGTGALIVRGSKAWDSRVYVDDIAIPTLFHFGGLTSTVNSAVVEDLAFQPGNYSDEYGRGIGGLIRADVRTPAKKGLHGYVDVNPFDVSGLVEGRLTDDWSFSVSARRGLVDLTLPWFLKTFVPQAGAVVGFTLAPVYWDYQVRVERRVANSPDRFFVSLIGASDAWAFTQPNPFLDPDTEGNQGSYGTSTLYNRLTVGFDKRMSDRVTFTSRNSVGFDAYSLTGTTADVAFKGTQVPIQLRERLRFDWPEAKLSITGGLDFYGTPLFVDAQSPPGFKANQIPDPYVERHLVAEKSTSWYLEPGLFVEATWQPFESLKIVGGSRVDYESYMKKAWVDPRIWAAWTPLAPLTVKGALGLFHQPPDYRTGQLSPIFGNPNLLPEGATHAMVGAEVRFTDFLELDVQGYYKWLFAQARQVLANGLGSDFNIPGAESRYSSLGYGRSYGVELLLRHKLSKNFFGWIAYSLSRFDRDYYGNVAYAPGPLDQPHNLIIVASYKLPWDVVVGGRFRFASGPLVTPIVASLFDAQGNYYFPLPGLPWSERLPPFFQLDLRVDKRFVFDGWSLGVYVDVQNVTNQQNPEGVFYNFNYTSKSYVYGIPILPAIGAKGEW